MLRWSAQLSRSLCLIEFLKLKSSVRPVRGALGALDRTLSFSTATGAEREYVQLNNLSDRPGASRSATRLGRGIGTGKGKTSGRGHKGQKARTGRQVKIGFEGGQTPIKRYTPKRGFHNRNSVTYTPLNLSRLKECIDSGRLPGDGLITMKLLRDTGTVQRRLRDGIKLLAGQRIIKPLERTHNIIPQGSAAFDKTISLEVSQASVPARAAIERLGGSITTVYYNKLGLRALLMPERFEAKGRLLPRPARPPPKRVSRFEAIGRIPAPTAVLQSSAEAAPA